MTTERFLLDTNILVYAADLTAGERHQRALEILDRAVRRDCILTLQALAEFFHVTTRKRMVARAEAAVQLRDWATEFPIVSAKPGSAMEDPRVRRRRAVRLLGRAPPGHRRAVWLQKSC